MGDALDDGEFEAYEPEPEGELDLGDDDNEAPAAGLGKRKADDEGDEEDGDGGGGKKKKKKQRGKKKRKGGGEGAAAVAEAEADATDDAADDAADGAADEDEEQGEEGKKKKRKRKKKKATAGGGAAAGAMGTAEGQAAFLWDTYCELLDISPLDRDVQRLPASRILLPSKATPATPPAAGNNKKGDKQGGKAKVPETGITDFLKRTLPGLQKLASDKANRLVGRPLVVIVSPAAVRANDLAKELRVRLPNQRTAKLFAKHIKAQEQAEALKKEFNALAVGTPARLGKLLEMGAFSLTGCRLLVLDASFRDAKEFTLLSLPGVAKDLALLLKEHVLPAMEGQAKGSEGLRIAMF